MTFLIQSGRKKTNISSREIQISSCFCVCFSGEAAAGGSGGEAGVDGKALSTGEGSHGESLPGAGSSSDHDIEEANSSADPDEETDHHHADHVTPSHGKKLILAHFTHIPKLFPLEGSSKYYIEFDSNLNFDIFDSFQHFCQI